MNQLLIVSFYTKNTIYEKEIEDLITSCKSIGIDYHIEGRNDLGSWEKNCCQKPLFILECLKRFQTPLLWVDADAILLKKPALAFEAIDLALFFEKTVSLGIKQVRAGTIYVAPTTASLDFVSLWHETCQAKLSCNEEMPFPDQSILSSLLHETRSLIVDSLPLGYIQIFDRDVLPFEEVYIVHFQASRTARMDPIFWKHLSGRELKAIRLANT